MRSAKIWGTASPSESSKETDGTASQLIERVPLSQAGEDLTREVQDHLTSQLEGLPFTSGATWLGKKEKFKEAELVKAQGFLYLKATHVMMMLSEVWGSPT